MDKGSRQTGLTITALMLLLASVVLAFAIDATSAYAAPAQIAQPAAVTAPVVIAVAQAADVEAVAAPGEGIIRIVTRVCGAAPSAAAWQAVAAANAITPPTYLVLLGQRLTVSCSSPTPGMSGSQSENSLPAPAAAPSGWANPLPGACITDTYGWHDWRGYVHQGVDLGAGTGTPIHAAADGQVTRSGWVWSGYGISVTIGHGDDWTTHYAHMSRTAVSVGQWVNAGDVIGYVGATGQVTGPHLHLEVATSWAVLGSQFNPVPFLRERGVWLGC